MKRLNLLNQFDVLMHYGHMKIIVKSMYFLIKNIIHFVQRLLSDDTQIFQTINHQHMFIYQKST